jgi:hypothetical protein
MYLKAGDRVLDVGCADGTLFRQVHGFGESVPMGKDPELDRTPNRLLLPGPILQSVRR